MKQTHSYTLKIDGEAHTITSSKDNLEAVAIIWKLDEWRVLSKTATRYGTSKENWKQKARRDFEDYGYHREGYELRFFRLRRREMVEALHEQARELLNAVTTADLENNRTEKLQEARQLLWKITTELQTRKQEAAK